MNDQLGVQLSLWVELFCLVVVVVVVFVVVVVVVVVPRIAVPVCINLDIIF